MEWNGRNYDYIDCVIVVWAVLIAHTAACFFCSAGCLDEEKVMSFAFHTHKSMFWLLLFDMNSGFGKELAQFQHCVLCTANYRWKWLSFDGKKWRRCWWLSTLYANRPGRTELNAKIQVTHWNTARCAEMRWTAHFSSFWHSLQHFNELLWYCHWVVFPSESTVFRALTSNCG